MFLDIIIGTGPWNVQNSPIMVAAAIPLRIIEDIWIQPSPEQVRPQFITTPGSRTYGRSGVEEVEGTHTRLRGTLLQKKFPGIYWEKYFYLITKC